MVSRGSLSSSSLICDTSDSVNCTFCCTFFGSNLGLGSYSEGINPVTPTFYFLKLHSGLKRWSGASLRHDGRKRNCDVYLRQAFRTKFALCFTVYSCTSAYVHVTEWKQDLYQNTFIHPLLPPPADPETQRERERALKVSECRLFTHDLPLILKQEYIIVQIQFEKRMVSAFSLSSPVMGRDWDGCERLILFNSVWFSCGMGKHTQTEASAHLSWHWRVIVVVVVEWGVGAGGVQSNSG